MPSEKQINRWLVAATIAPLISLSAGEPWLWLATATFFCGALARFSAPVGRWGSILQWVTALVVLAILLPQAKKCWPTDPHIAVPLILLALAVWSTMKGLRSAAGVGCVLFWFIIIMCAAILLTLTSEVQIAYMLPEWGMGSWTTVLLLLIPAAPLAPGKKGIGWITGTVATVTAALTAGVLSTTVSTNADNAFYEAVRSVRIRLEPILGAVTTAGWYLVLTVLLSVSGESASKLHENIRKPAVASTAIIVAVVLLCGLHIPAWIGVIFVAISWVFMPLLAQFLEGRKKMKKSEKTP